MTKFKSFKTWNDVPDYGGGYRGTVACTYARLVEVFGEPTLEQVETKTEVQWVLQFPDCTIAAIYNWKNGKTYKGDEGLAVEDMCEWHVGGKTQKAVMWVKRVLGENRDV